jgi:hypothetical protein
MIVNPIKVTQESQSSLLIDGVLRIETERVPDEVAHALWSRLDYPSALVIQDEVCTITYADVVGGERDLVVCMPVQRIVKLL